MSVRVSNYVWQHSGQKGAALLLLLAIADQADDDGANAWPSIASLAKKIRMARRTVQLLTDQLVAAGELRVEEGGGVHGTHRYAVVLPPDLDAPRKPGRPRTRAATGETPGNGVQSLHPPGPPATMNGGEVGGFEGGENIAPVQNPGAGGAKFAGGVQKTGEGGAVAVAPDPSLTRPLNPSLDPSVNARSRARPVYQVLKPKDREAAERSAAAERVAAARGSLVAEREARLARLGTDEATQGWWHGRVFEPRRLPDVFREAILIAPPAGTDVPALLFPSGEKAARAGVIGKREVLYRLRKKWPRAPDVLYLVESEVLAALDGGGETEVANGGDGRTDPGNPGAETEAAGP